MCSDLLVCKAVCQKIFTEVLLGLMVGGQRASTVLVQCRAVRGSPGLSPSGWLWAPRAVLPRAEMLELSTSRCLVPVSNHSLCSPDFKCWDQESLASFWGRIPPTQYCVSLFNWGLPAPVTVLVSCWIQTGTYSWPLLPWPQRQPDPSDSTNMSYSAAHQASITMFCVLLFLSAGVGTSLNSTGRRSQSWWRSPHTTLHLKPWYPTGSRSVHSGASTPPTNQGAEPPNRPIHTLWKLPHS